MSEQDQQKQQTMKVAMRMSLVVVLMFGFGYLLVPLYDIICEVTGLNGKTGVIEQAEAAPDTEREIVVKFTGSLGAGTPFEFRPKASSMTVHPGGVYDAVYIAKNLAPVAVVAQATPSVSPREASLYFNKTECFCFTRQEFAAGEEREMPVQFVIDRDIPNYIKSVVLSYTFFEMTDEADS